ncbi:hypothetical protein [Streptomyces yangpuensis]|uniref:hypothetical protein n=1 Tax=Streptomyces yangpuensis TaxID=1648182 RepID=UPI0036660B52
MRHREHGAGAPVRHRPRRRPLREDFNRTGRRHDLDLDLDLVGDRTLAEYLRGTPEAIRYPEAEHACAKVVITA